MAPEDRQIREEEAAAERELHAAAEAAHKAEIRSAAAKARLDNSLRATRDLLSRRRAASITGLTPGRVQQIVDSKATGGLSPGGEKALVSLDPAQLGAVLRDMRQESGRTLEDLAAEAEIHPTALSALERGRANPTTTVLSRYIQALGGRLVAEFDASRSTSSPSDRK